MLGDIIFCLIIIVIVFGLFALFLWENLKCNHEWEYIHDTKYDNMGFRDKYPVILVCTKCGKVKVIK